MRFPQSDDRLVAHVGEARHDPIAVDQLDQGRPLQHLGGMAWKIEPHDVGDGNGGVIAQVDLARGEGTERSSQHTSVGKMRGRCIELVLRLGDVDGAEENKGDRNKPESRVALAARPPVSSRARRRLNTGGQAASATPLQTRACDSTGLTSRRLYAGGLRTALSALFTRPPA